jgi:tetratricopeptide (TPR) repeat protein
VLKEARRRQEKFEELRRWHLPRTTSSAGPCDERIGRYCLRHSDDDDWEEAPDPPAVQAARNALIAYLDSAARRLPGNGWIAGQRVRYYVEAGQPQAALAAAADCRAQELSWCHSLAGYALHAAREYPESEHAFEAALARMSDEQRCEWTDLSRILEGDLRGRYRHVPCAERDSLQRRIFWLADPFFSVPGNELRTEHFSRHVYSRLLRHSEAPEGDRWGNDLHRFFLRYGWPVGWERVSTTITQAGPVAVVSHYGRGAHYFLPEAQFVDEPSSVRQDDWALDPRRPRAGHSPAYSISALEPLPHELAIFYRGDSAVVVVAYRLADDSIPKEAEVEAVLIAVPNERGPWNVTREHFWGREGRLALTVPAVPQLLSLEVLAVNEERGARARYGLPAAKLDSTASPRLSDLLLTYAVDSLPDTLEEGITTARTSNEVIPGERLGLFWELYDIGPTAEVLTTSLSIVKQGKSIFRRVVQLVGIGSDKPPVSLRWQDVSSAGQAMDPRAVAVDLPDNLARGRYVLRLDLHLADGRQAALEKQIVVR